MQSRSLASTVSARRTRRRRRATVEPTVRRAQGAHDMGVPRLNPRPICCLKKPQPRPGSGGDPARGRVKLSTPVSRGTFCPPFHHRLPCRRFKRTITAPRARSHPSSQALRCAQPDPPGTADPGPRRQRRRASMEAGQALADRPAIGDTWTGIRWRARRCRPTQEPPCLTRGRAASGASSLPRAIDSRIAAALASPNVQAREDGECRQALAARFSDGGASASLTALARAAQSLPAMPVTADSPKRSCSPSPGM